MRPNDLPSPCREDAFHVAPVGHVVPGPPCHFEPSPATPGRVSPATWSFVPDEAGGGWDATLIDAWLASMELETGRVADVSV